MHEVRIFVILHLRLLFIENNSRVLIGQELWMKSSYPFGSSPNLQHIRHYDVIWSYIENTYMTL